MAFPQGDPFTLDSGDGVRTSNEAILSVFQNTVTQFANNQGEQSSLQDKMDSIVEKLCDSKEEAEAMKRDINTTMTVNKHAFDNVHLVKALGLPSFKLLRTFLEEGRTRYFQPDKKKSVLNFNLEMTPQYIISLVKACPQLSSVENHEFRKIVEAFVNDKSPPFKDPTGRVEQIRQTARRNALRYLSKDCHSTSLADYANNLTFPSRKVSVSALEWVHKKLTDKTKTNDQKYDLIQNDEKFNHSFTCYHCPSTAPVKTTKSNYEIQPSWLSQINVCRVKPHENLEEVKAHFKKVHSVGDAQFGAPSTPGRKGPVPKDNGHNFLLVCQRCLNKGSHQMSVVLTCCQECHFDHQVIVHGHEDVFLSTYQMIKAEVINDSFQLDLAESYLLLRCNYCLTLNQSRSLNLRHERNCLGRMISNSLFYAQEKSYASLYETETSRARTRENDKAVLAQQIRKFLSHGKTKVSSVPQSQSITFDENEDGRDDLQAIEGGSRATTPNFKALLQSNVSENIFSKDPKRQEKEQEKEKEQEQEDEEEKEDEEEEREKANCDTSASPEENNSVMFRSPSPSPPVDEEIILRAPRKKKKNSVVRKFFDDEAEDDEQDNKNDETEGSESEEKEQEGSTEEENGEEKEEEELQVRRRKKRKEGRKERKKYRENTREKWGKKRKRETDSSEEEEEVEQERRKKSGSRKKKRKEKDQGKKKRKQRNKKKDVLRRELFKKLLSSTWLQDSDIEEISTESDEESGSGSGSS